MRGEVVEDGAQPCDAAETSATSLLPLRFLGMGLWIVWQWCTHSDSTLLFPDVAMAFDFAYSDAAMRVVDLMTMVAIALLWPRLTPITSHRGLMGAGFACVGLGTVGTIAGLNGAFAFPLVISLFSGVAAFGGAVPFLSWAEVYSRLAPNRMMLLGMLSLMLAGCVSFVLTNLVAPYPLAGTVAVPLVSFVLCWLSSAYVPARATPAPDGAAVARYEFPWKPVVVMAFAGFTAGLGSFSLFGQTSDSRMLATFVVGARFLAASLLSGGRVRLGHFVVAAFALAAAGFVLVALVGVSNPAPAAFLVMLAYIALCVVGLALLGRTSFAAGVPSLWLFGFGRAASELMMGVGSYAKMIPGVSGIPQSAYALAVLAVAGLVCLLPVALLWRSEESRASGWAVAMVDRRTGGRAESEREVVSRRCGELAASHGLTEREKEVLEMLAAGASYQEVCQGLLVSMGTVKTHVRHVYAKLSVHSREEAPELIRTAGR